MRYTICMVVLICASQCLYTAHDFPRSRRNAGKLYSGDNDYGYVEVRKGVFMFYWLYYAGGNKETAYDKPLITWLQGGRIVPGFFMGNFMEIGPQDVNLNTRNYSWVNKRNVLFIDFQVGIGFSYTRDSSLLVHNDEDLAKDIVELIKKFLDKFAGFKTVPTHIFSQGHGAKIAPILAYKLHGEVQAGTIEMNLKSLCLGGPLVSPKHTILAYPEFMYAMGFMDDDTYENVSSNAVNIAAACDQRRYQDASDLQAAGIIHIPNIRAFNIYNVVKSPLYNTLQLVRKLKDETVARALSDVVPADIRIWASEYRTSMKSAKMRPSTEFVEKILNETDLTVVVYNGQLDGAIPILGTVKWVENLNWHGAKEFMKATRLTIQGDGNGNYKQYGRFSFWWIYKAGHLVPSDNPEAMEHILKLTVDSTPHISF